MPASKNDMPLSSDSPYGETDFAKVDAYENTASDYEEIPEITDEMVMRGVRGDGRELLKRGRGRPALADPKRHVTMRLDGDLIDAMRASGPGWQVRANEALRARFKP